MHMAEVRAGAALSQHGTSDVCDLKVSLRNFHGFPMRIQQLLHKGNSLDSSTKLDAAMDLQLVLLGLSTEAQQVEAAKELAEACVQGNL